MSLVLRSEWLKLRTIPLHLILWGIAGGFVFVITFLVAVLTSDPESFRGDDLMGLVGGTSIVAGLLVSVVSALAVTAEFSYGTIRTTLSATPNRTTVFVSKAILLAAVGAAIGLVIGVVSYVVGLLIINGRGGDVGLSNDDGTLAALVGVPVLFAILALFGYGLGLLFRNSPAAVSVAILWPLLVETVIATVLSVGGVDDPVRYLPYQSGFALVVPDTEDLVNGRIGGGLFFGGVVLALVAIAIAINGRRDV